MTHSRSLAILIGILATQLVQADWPSYRGNPQRTSFREQSIAATSWKPAWSIRLASPNAAWMKPARGSIWQNLTYIEPRVTDDRANVPLIAKTKSGEQLLVVPSSADDRLLGVDLNTGRTRWQVETDGPIRFAPSIKNGIAYFGSDDGQVRAVDLDQGKTVWTSEVGPGYRAIVGNGRLVSPHPIRTSVLAQGELVIAHAGLFPSQGVYSVGLNKADGSVVWRRQISASSQGYLLGSGQRTYVPTGRSVPYAMDSSNGQKLFDLPSPGGTFCMLTSDAFFTGPGNTAEVQSFSTQNRAKMLSYKARQISVGNGKIWTANGARIVCHDLTKLVNGKQEILWQKESINQNGLLVTGDKSRRLLVSASRASIEILNADNGKLIQQLVLDERFGEVVHLAVASADGSSPDTLIATTQNGNVLAWHGVGNSQQTAGAKHELPAVDLQPKPDSASKKGSVKDAIDHLKSKKGFALIAGSNIERDIQSLIANTSLHIVGVVGTESRMLQLREHFRNRMLYGHRVSIFHQSPQSPMRFAPGLFNLVFNSPGSHLEDSQLRPMTCAGSGVFVASTGKVSMQPPMTGQGRWRHQYAGPRNLADANDSRVGNAAAFKLKWFGGVGPSRMPDRHLRGPAPLAAGSCMIVQGDGVLIGVDPANGTERWQYQLPDQAMRYVTPYDCGYVCLSEDGEKVTLAANRKIQVLDSHTGTSLNTSEIEETDLRYGYLSRSENQIIVSKMKLTAPRIATDRKTQRTFVDLDYRSGRPLVCSRKFQCLNGAMEPIWTRNSRGVIPNGSIAVDYKNSRLVFLEGRSASCLEHRTDRIPVETILEKASLVCVDTESGKTVWEQEIKWELAQNILYTQISDDGIILSSSQSVSGKAKYLFRNYSIANGSQKWSIVHNHIKGGLYHGEQVHHPLILKRTSGESVLVAEPYFYDLKSGKKAAPFGDNPDWAIRRPGHSCGTLSGTGNCLFFRANNPTVLNLNQTQENKFTALAPSRPGCWINIIPAGGRLLIPEASASCVCKYSLQTSMCFDPISITNLNNEVKFLPNIGTVKK